MPRSSLSISPASNAALLWHQSYAYDRYGNRSIAQSGTTQGVGINSTQAAVVLNTNTNRVYGPGETETFHPLINYDNAGNQTKDYYTFNGVHYDRTYDGENRMTSSTTDSYGSQTSMYTYNGDGQRVRRKVNGVETWQVYGMDGELLAEYAANAAPVSPQKEYGYRNGQLLITAEASTTTTSGTNVALATNGAVATASSVYSSAYPASGANDGDRKGLNWGSGGGWNEAGPANTFPDWLQVDFNGSQTISEIDVFSVQDHYNWPVEPTAAMSFSLYGLTGYEVQYWDGSSWATIPGGSVSGNNQVWRKFTFAAVSTTRIRVSMTASSDGWSRLAEVEAWTGPSPVPRYDQALAANGAVATASSSYSSGYDASGVNNGDRKSLNWGNGGGWNDPGLPFPDWLQIDFAGSKTIDEIDVYTLQDNWGGAIEPTEAMTFSQWGLTGYEVQYWDGGAWVTVTGGSVTGNNKVWRKFSFTAINTTKIRVLTNASIDGYSRITEVEAYSPATTATNGNINWLVTDQLGTPRMIVDQTGSLASMKRHDYLPFGEEIGGPQVALLGGRTTTQGYSGDSTRQHFTGYEADAETGLNFAQARYQSSAQGRFTSVDPFGASASVGDPQSFNRYSYVLNNPTNLTDPSGMMTGADASQSWGDVSGTFWGDAFDCNASHFGGPAIVANGMDYFADRRNGNGSVPAPPPNQTDTEYVPYVGNGIVDPGETSADEGYSDTDEPTREVTILGNKVNVNYGKDISLTDRLAASRLVSQAAGLINANAGRLEDDEKKAIMKIRSFSVVGRKKDLGVSGSTFSLDMSRINAMSPAYLGSLFGHEGQHLLNTGKYSGANLWLDEQSAGTTQLGIGRTLGYTSAEIRGLQQWIDPSNRDGMQRHILKGMKSL